MLLWRRSAGVRRAAQQTMGLIASMHIRQCSSLGCHGLVGCTVCVSSRLSLQ